MPLGEMDDVAKGWGSWREDTEERLAGHGKGPLNKLLWIRCEPSKTSSVFVWLEAGGQVESRTLNEWRWKLSMPTIAQLVNASFGIPNARLTSPWKSIHLLQKRLDAPQPEIPHAYSIS